MHNIWLIARREYMERIRTRAFLIMTLLVPGLLGGIGFAAAMIGGHSGGSHIAIVTSDQRFAEDLKTEVASAKDGSSAIVVPAAEATPEAMQARLKQGGLDGFLLAVPGSEAGVRPTFRWVPKAKADLVTQSAISGDVRRVLTREGLTRSGMKAPEVEELLKPVELDSSSPASKAVCNRSPAFTPSSSSCTSPSCSTA